MDLGYYTKVFLHTEGLNSGRLFSIMLKHGSVKMTAENFNVFLIVLVF